MVQRFHILDPSGISAAQSGKLVDSLVMSLTNETRYQAAREASLAHKIISPMITLLGGEAPTRASYLDGHVPGGVESQASRSTSSKASGDYNLTPEDVERLERDMHIHPKDQGGYTRVVRDPMTQKIHIPVALQ